MAPNSDQPFLDRFGWVMNQDQGTYAISFSEFKIADHPIFEKVSAFDGEGVSPITLANDQIDGVQSTILAPAKSIVRRNTVTGKGPSEFPDSMDASVIVATVGEGHIAGHFDRNTFFNTNGAGYPYQRIAFRISKSCQRSFIYRISKHHLENRDLKSQRYHPSCPGRSHFTKDHVD